MNKTVFTTSETAKLLNVSKETIINWINKDKLQAYETFGKHFRICLNDIIDFAKINNISVSLKENYNNIKNKFLIINTDPKTTKFIKKFMDVYFPKYEVIIAKDHITACLRIGELCPKVCFINENDINNIDLYIKSIISHNFSENIKILLLNDSENNNITSENSYSETNCFYIKKPIKDRKLFKVIYNILN